MNRRRWTRGLLLCFAAGVLVASTMSFLDWRLNPGGIFRGEDGTSWSVVWETWVSWFLPVFLLIGVLALPLLLWRSRSGTRRP